jgi:polar amino acid transport system substrate-binding protein
LASRSLHIATLEDARGYTIGAYVGDARGIYLRDKGFNVETVPSDALNPRKLLAGRIDLWVSTPLAAQQNLVPNGWAATIVPLLTFHRVEHYLACNPTVSASLVDRLNAALTAMSEDGTVAAIEHRYEGWPQPPAQ